VLAKSHDMFDSFVLSFFVLFRARAPRTLNSSTLAGTAIFLLFLLMLAFHEIVYQRIYVERDRHKQI